MVLLTYLLTYLLGNRNSRDGWNVPELVTVQQSSIMSGSIVLFLTLGLTGTPYKRTYLLTYLLGNRTMVLGFFP